MKRARQAESYRARLRVWAALALALPLASCSVFRPTPTHGGGKRMDEEQRLVAAAIGRTAERMNFSRIRKSRVSLEVSSLDTSGGVQDVNAGSTDRSRVPVPPLMGGIQNLFGFRASPWLQANTTRTNQDLYYLEEGVKARLRTRNYQIVSPEESDVHIVVLVDCLGTNLSRKDLALAYRDDLKATCTITWYAVDSKTQQIVSKAENLSTSSDCADLNIRFSPLTWSREKTVEKPADPIFMPEVRSIATGERGNTPVANLLSAPPPPPGNRGRFVAPKGPKGFRGGRPGRNASENPASYDPLPPEGEGGMQPDVLPPLDPNDIPPPDAPDAGNDKKPADGDLSKMPMGELVRAAWQKSRDKDVEGLRSAINAIEAKKPDAPALEKLKARLEQLDKNKP